MSDAEQLTDAERQTIVSALQQTAQGQWPAAVELIRPLADAGKPIGVALATWFMGQAGQAVQGVEYARKAARGPIAPGMIAANYVGWSQNDPALRQYMVEFMKAAVAAGWTVDPVAQAQQLAQQGETDRAVQMLTDTAVRTPAQTDSQWESLAADIAQSQQRVDADLRGVAEARAQALSAIADHETSIAAERDRVRALVGETTALVQNVAANNLAADYAGRAKAATERARRWTIATLVVSAAAIVLAAAFVLVGLARSHDVSTVLSKAAISLPLLAMAAYLNRLGTEERRDARSWTHIELQIRTARPYLGNLPDDLRQQVQAALALRFFPGQAQDPHGGGLDVDVESDLKLIRELQSQARAG